MKAWIYYILISVIFITGVSTGIYFNHSEKPTKPNKPAITPPSVETNYTYVSLGDSIAEGYGLPSTKDENGFVPGSYADSLKNKLSAKHSKFKAFNYAQAGQTSTDLLNILTTLSGTDLSAENYQKKQNIQAANTITVCIGANDILGPAQNNLASFIMSSDATSLIDALDTGLTTFQTNFPEILSKLRGLNANAQIVFSNIYNPYKEFVGVTDKSVAITGFPISIDSAKFNLIGQMSESYIDSGNFSYNAQSSKNIENGLNQIIESTITADTKCSLLDVKDSFDDYFVANSKYDIVQCNILSQTSVALNSIMNSIDPHPTQEGHNLIDSLFDNNLTNSLG